MIDPPTPARSWRVPALIAGLALVAGAASAVAVLALAGWRPVPVKRFEMTVLLERDATTQQRDTLGAALRSAFPGEDLRIRTKAEIYEDFRKRFEDQIEDLTEYTSVDDMQEQLIIATSGRSLDCDALAKVGADPAVDRLDVTRTDSGTGRVSAYRC